MKKYIRLKAEDLGASNLRYVIGEMESSNVSFLGDLCIDVQGFSDSSFGGEMFFDEEPLVSGDKFIIDIPILGYRLKDVLLIPTGASYYNKDVYSLKSFEIERIYHLVCYQHSKDKKLSFWYEDSMGYTYDLEEAGCYLGGLIRSDIEKYHNGFESTGVWTKEFYMERYSAKLNVGYLLRPEVKASVEQGILEYGDLNK